MLTTSGKLDLLRSLPGLGGLPQRELARAAVGIDELELSVGEVLVRDGLPARQAFIVVDGNATVSSRGHTVAIVGPGAFVGHVPGPEDHLQTATVVAATPMTVLVLGPGLLRRLAQQLDREEVV